jgi:hypothetical protein
LARSLQIPGPADYPQVRQGYEQIVQWKGGHLSVVKAGTDKGWVKGYS